MVKKLSATGQRFSVAAKHARAVEREAREAEKTTNQKMLDESILPFDILDHRPDDRWFRVLDVEWDGNLIAIVSHENTSPFVNVLFLDAQETQVQIQHVQACRSMLTVRKVAVALMLPYGAAKLAALVRQCDAKAEAAQLDAVTGAPTAASSANRL